MDDCKNCMKNNICSKAKNIENYKIKSDCRDFIHKECYEILHDLSSEQIRELMEFADSLRKNSN